MSRILVIEDEQDIADFVRRGLIRSGFDATVVHTGYDGIEAVHGSAPDLVVLDLMLPDIDGIEVCRRLRADTDVGIVILTARDQIGDRIRGLEAGADDYLPKPFAFEELLARIRSVLRRRTASHGDMIRIGDLEIDVQRRGVRRGGRTIDLTAREFDLLKLLAENAGRPLRRETIVQRIWGYDFGGETDPVKVYVNYLRRKLNAEGEEDMIRALRGFGYVLKESP